MEFIFSSLLSHWAQVGSNFGNKCNFASQLLSVLPLKTQWLPFYLSSTYNLSHLLPLLTFSENIFHLVSCLLQGIFYSIPISYDLLYSIPRRGLYDYQIVIVFYHQKALMKHALRKTLQGQPDGAVG